MPNGAQKYEVFIESVNPITCNTSLANWSWHRVDARGKVLVRGTPYGSLAACYAAAKRHSANFGQVPVKINLHEPGRR